MALIVCPLCVREDDVHLLRTLPDGRKEARCDDCDFTFVFGAPTPEAKPVRKASTPRKPAARIIPPRPAAYVIGQFPKASHVADADRERADALRTEYLATTSYEPDPRVAKHWAKFGWVFSEGGLEKAVISDLQGFAHDPTGADTGSTAELDKAWTLLGEFEGARRVRAMTERLLRGRGEVEDRFTDVLADSLTAMPGWGDPLLTKTLAVAQPHRFLPIVTYAEKRTIAAAVYGLELPTPDATSWTIGRLAVWSNDLLVELAEDGFTDLWHVAGFLRWAEGR